MEFMGFDIHDIFYCTIICFMMIFFVRQIQIRDLSEKLEEIYERSITRIYEYLKERKESGGLNEKECIKERRRVPRMKEQNEVTITVVSGENNLPKEIIIDNYTKNVSLLGVKIQTHTFLPVRTIVELDFISKAVNQQIKTIGRVRWVKAIIENKSYEVGLEFFSNSSDAIKRLGDYVKEWKQND